MLPEFKAIDPVGVKDRVYDYAKKVLDYSIVKQESFAGENPILAWLYQYIFLNILLARPSFSVVCTWDRKKQLEDMGMNEAGMIALIAIQAVADHTAPNFVIAGILVGMHQMTDIPTSVAFPASWILGRTTWGAMCGITHASVYAATKGLRFSTDSFDNQLNLPLDLSHDKSDYAEIDYKFSQVTF